MVARHDEIDRWLGPAGPEFAAEEYHMLCATLGAAALDDDTARREMMGFVEATHRLPAFALKGACGAFRRGEVGDGQWMPKAGQVCIEAQKRIGALAKERRELHSVLTAKIGHDGANAERKKRLLEEAAKACASIALEGLKAEAERGGGLGYKPPEPRVEAYRQGEDEEHYKARMLANAIEVGKRPMPKMSDTLLRSMNIQPAREAAE